MKISLNWLKDLIDIQESTDTIADQLTGTGLEVEGVEETDSIPGGLEGIVIGEVLTCESHPKADRLRITTVDIGEDEPKQIVCGAPNVAAGQKVAIAVVGSMLYPAGSDPFKIKKSKIRGEVSEGMICAEDELGLGDDHDGIMVLETTLSNGTPAAEFFNVEKTTVIEIGLTPNRADAASHLGVARDVKALHHREVKLPSVEAFKVENNNYPIEVVIQNAEACPRYSGITVSGIEVKESPEWLQDRLRSIGLAPLNNIVDVTNYILHELGQPLHAFDADEIKGAKIIVKTQPEGTKFTTLDSVERTLNAEDLIISNTEEGMAIAGVFGGLGSGIKNTTRNIFIESAYFQPDFIRKTAMRHGLKTDASFRYERGTDPNITIYALKRAALLVKEVAGGTISSDIVDVYPEEIQDFRVPVKYKNIHRLIGQQLSHEKIKSILQWLDIQIQEETEDGFIAIVPPYRVDVTREADIVEEIIRIYGFNNIELPETVGSDFLSDFAAFPNHKVKQEIREMLAASGLNEIISNSLTKPGYAKNNSGLNAESSVDILNKLSEDLGVMRQSIAYGGLESLARNINHRQRNLSMFEFGKVYMKSGDKYKEKEKLAIWLTGNRAPENWLSDNEVVTFHDLSGIVNKVLYRFGINDADSEVIHEGQFDYALKQSLNGKEIVTLGKLNRKTTKQAEVSQEVLYAEFDWNYLMKQTGKPLKYKEVARFPEVRRDLSLVIDRQVSFEKIRKVAEQYERRLLKKISVFDVYEGQKIGENKKAYALSFILQDSEKTLNDKAIDKTMNKLMKAFEKEIDAHIRK
ncbi:MAG: phenylalanine--tRNA ligase subunit beta [Cyclobacteriaceae bacterium]